MADTIGYLPSINAPATQMSTVFEILNQAKRIKDMLQLSSIVCVFDQALYAKACEVVWKHPTEFHDVVLRMGAFHTICNLLAIIGKRFSDAGLRDLAVESGIVAEGSINGVLEGKKYNRSLWMHKIIYEALLRTAWKNFQSWLLEHHAENIHQLEDLLKIIKDLHDETSQDMLQTMLEDASCEEILLLFIQFWTI